MHIEAVEIDIQKAVDDERLGFSPGVRIFMWALVTIGALAFGVGLAVYDHALLWSAYFSNLLFWMGLAFGGVMISVIFQIVKAKWSTPVRRLTEANLFFIPWALLLWVGTYWGKEHLFSWARAPMPGRELWMSPLFTFFRNGILLVILSLLLWRFVGLSLRGDIAIAKAKARIRSRWDGFLHNFIVGDCKGSEAELQGLQATASWYAPLIVAVYAVVYSLFAFEMIMGMNVQWFSNMFGGFIFIGNIYCGWAMTSILTCYLAERNRGYGSIVKRQQLHDLGKLTFGFGILWAYLFFAQFLPIWYGNLPEETQWLILRLREYPWKGLAWVILSMCFVIPFITLLSRDVKKTPWALTFICCVILVGMALERYIIVMPEASPTGIPLGIFELCFFLGMGGAYFLSIDSFLTRFPYAPLGFFKIHGQCDEH